MASPPFPHHSQLPALNTTNLSNKKRGAGDGVLSPALKRRKASTLSITSTGSAHPLRQTSFPPDELGTPLGPRSPSVDIDNVSFVSGSQISSAIPGKKKRGRKSKADKAREQTPSVAAGGKGSTVASLVNGVARSNVGAPGDAPDDEAEGDEPDTGMATAARTREERNEEKRLRAALVNCMDLDQYDRISAWRAAKLPDSVIKRLVNATVSQSVPASVVNAVRSVTKYFLTELIINAQQVQGEWIKAENESQAESEWPGMVLSRGDPKVREAYDQQAEMYEGRPTFGGPNATWDRDSAPVILKEKPRGPLRPDHLREAWRRYKRSVQSHTAGTHSLWHVQRQSGAERFPVRTGGKIIFK